MEGKKATGRPRRRRENIKADLQDLQTRSVTAWIHSGSVEDRNVVSCEHNNAYLSSLKG